MPTFVALLRGINVGKAKRVAMADLRILLGGLGYTNITTLLNSGNVVFHATQGTAVEHAAAITDAIASQLKINVPVIVKSAKDLAVIIAKNTLAEKSLNHSHFLVAFAQNPEALPGLAAIESLAVPPEQFLVGKEAAYLHCAHGISESKAAEALLKSGKITTRNLATVLKLQALANEASA